MEKVFNLSEEPYTINDQVCMTLGYCQGVEIHLIESGIRVDDGRVISEGKVVEIARESHRLLINGDCEEFCEYYARNIKELSQEEQEIFNKTQCSGLGFPIGLCYRILTDERNKLN